MPSLTIAPAADSKSRRNGDLRALPALSQILRDCITRAVSRASDRLPRMPKLWGLMGIVLGTVVSELLCDDYKATDAAKVIY